MVSPCRNTITSKRYVPVLYWTENHKWELFLPLGYYDLYVLCNSGFQGLAAPCYCYFNILCTLQLPSYFNLNVVTAVYVRLLGQFQHTLELAPKAEVACYKIITFLLQFDITECSYHVLEVSCI
jgi:hypothetical protein